MTFQTSKIHFLNGKFIFFTGFGDNAGGVAGTNNGAGITLAVVYDVP